MRTVQFYLERVKGKVMDLREEMSRRFDRLDDNVEKLFDLHRETMEGCAKHMKECGEDRVQLHAEVGEVKKEVTGVIVEHRERVRERRAGYQALWIGMILAVAGALFAVIKISWRV